VFEHHDAGEDARCGSGKWSCAPRDVPAVRTQSPVQAGRIAIADDEDFDPIEDGDDTVAERHDLGPTVLLAQLQGDQNADRVVASVHSAASMARSMARPASLTAIRATSSWTMRACARLRNPDRTC